MKRSTTFLRCKHEAFLNEGLMPVDCLEILDSNYGIRLETMKPKTIVDMILEMMQTATWDDSDIYKQEVDELVQDWCNNF